MDQTYFDELLERENQLHADMKCLIDKTLNLHDNKVQYPDMGVIDEHWEYPVSTIMMGRKYYVTGYIVAVYKDNEHLHVELKDRSTGATEKGFFANNRHYSDILYFLSEAHDAMEELKKHKETLL